MTADLLPAARSQAVPQQCTRVRTAPSRWGAIVIASFRAVCAGRRPDVEGCVS